MATIRLLYYSEATKEMSLADLKEILGTARDNNSSQDICGMLCYDNQFFLQVLEGDSEEVSELFIKIGQDVRHDRVAIMSVQQIEKPAFQNWQMGYAGSSELLQSLLQELNLDAFEPDKLTPKQAAEILYKLSKSQTEV
ncbi:putative BLUF domain containing protein [Vibrio nigripulchritudo MADA3029]|uniref:BLUF domain containing protein n=1 Tax=Vibrio nigripulchritudo SOn1 TaxID=1238450 RepID=A0AAV2VNB9_9VIBR|nr:MULTISPECIES: BLUF domain-containing protein [Vibrio]EGU60636.1 BLUF domain-containing protein [Vibrio nigripulchritudo ATCC 27043]KJY76940.1 blue light sensor protein [Vibrio nigripulchritudo]UAB68779.1 BLUF domain-containing protein [Vibrio sp. SCSIO 43132]CCN34426.1 putative BLUF domain containing protein [Vibrio nigripulchritudo AM115]CCN43317.1 putative BLUF domain containing protein [Vibrio nigripulchritudo FTn2]